MMPGKLRQYFYLKGQPRGTHKQLRPTERKGGLISKKERTKERVDKRTIWHVCEGGQRTIIIKSRPNGVKRGHKNSSFFTAVW